MWVSFTWHGVCKQRYDWDIVGSVLLVKVEMKMRSTKYNNVCTDN